MHDFNPGLDLAFLVGRELQQVSFGPYDLQFRFSDNVAIAVFGKLIHRGAALGNGQGWRGDGSGVTSSLPRLLKHTVTKVDVPNERLLRLHFSNGDQTDIFDENNQFEACTISGDPRGQIVI